MTFNPIAALNCIETIQNIGKTKNVIDIGAQTPTLSISFLEYLSKKFIFLNDNQKKGIDSLVNILKHNKTFNTKDFFHALNFSTYDSIDINGAYNSLQFDLNYNLKEKYKFIKVYDLVINNGTGEHIFDQYSLFKNIHNLCNLNGLMLHILPFIDWINHGFYNFHPIFFADLSAANDYEIIKLSIADRNGNEIVFNNSYYKYVYEQIKPHKNKTFFFKVLDEAKKKLGMNIFIVSVLKKKTENKFKVPLQGKYLTDIENIDLKTHYAQQRKGSANALNQLSDSKKRN